jgi:hypothetical protein
MHQGQADTENDRCQYPNWRRNAPILFGGEIDDHLSVDWASLIFTA